MNKKGILLVLFAAIMSLTTLAQGRMDMRINEVMVQNDSNYVDHYGRRSGWIELFNASYGTNGIEQMFITTKKLNLPQKDKNLYLQQLAKTDPSVYEIPGGDAETDIAPRTHVVFFANGHQAGGALHLPFTLVPGRENYIALYDVNGDLVDEVTVPANLPANCSYARNIDGRDSIAHEFTPSLWSIRDGKTDATAITKRMVAELIDHIEVYPAVKEDGITNQRVTIHYNCIGAFEVPDRRKIPERDILLETRKGVALSYAPAQIAI